MDKIALKKAKSDFDEFCVAAFTGIQCKVMAPAAAVAGVAAVPAVAFADFNDTVSSITGKANSTLQTIGYGFLILVAGLALIAIAKEILPAIFARETVEFKGHVKVAIVVVVLCIIAGFLPTLIKAFVDISGTGVDLGADAIVKSASSGQ